MPVAAGPSCGAMRGSSSSSRVAARAQQLAARVAVGGARLSVATRQQPVLAARAVVPTSARMHGLAKFVSDVEQGQMKKDIIPMKVGMTVKVGVTVVESGKSRVQPYQGLIIAMHKNSLNSSITVRKVFQGVGVERVFPIHSPLIVIEEVPTAGVPRVRGGPHCPYSPALTPCLCAAPFPSRTAASRHLTSLI